VGGVEAGAGLVDLELALDGRFLDDPGFFRLVDPEMEADLVAGFPVGRIEGLSGVVKGARGAQVEGAEGQLDDRAPCQFTGHHI